MLKCRILFIEVLVLAALVLYLLFLLFGRHHTVIAVLSDGLYGGYAETGDRIAFRTLYPGNQGYTVNFQSPYPCQDASGKNVTSLIVKGGATTFCTVTASSGPSSGVVFSYTVTQGTGGSVVDPTKTRKGSSGDGKEGIINDGVTPCKFCSPVIGGEDGNGGEAVGAEAKVRALSTGYVRRKITCSNGKAVVDDVPLPGDPPLVPGINLDWWANYGWTASLPPTSTACSNGTSFSSTGTYSYCTAKDPGTYTYSITLDNCNSGTGNLTISAAPQEQGPK
jgi:hypothetical protein